MSVSKEFVELRVRVVFKSSLLGDETIRHGLENLMSVCDYQWSVEYFDVMEDDVARWKAEDEQCDEEEDEDEQEVSYG